MDHKYGVDVTQARPLSPGEASALGEIYRVGLNFVSCPLAEGMHVTEAEGMHATEAEENLVSISRILGIDVEQAKYVAASVPWSLEETKKACMIGWTPERGWPEGTTFKQMVYAVDKEAAMAHFVDKIFREEKERYAAAAEA